jgi:hypothetical protein
MVARLSLLQLFLAFAVATARNDPRQVLRDDIPAVRKLRIEVVTIPWLVLTTLLLILLIYFWSD